MVAVVRPIASRVALNPADDSLFCGDITDATPSPTLPRCGRRASCGGGSRAAVCGLGRVYNLNRPPLRSGGGLGRGCEK